MKVVDLSGICAGCVRFGHRGDSGGLCRRRPLRESWGQRATCELVVVHSPRTSGEAESSPDAGRWSVARGHVCEYLAGNLSEEV